MIIVQAPYGGSFREFVVVFRIPEHHLPGLLTVHLLGLDADFLGSILPVLGVVQMLVGHEVPPLLLLPFIPVRDGHHHDRAHRNKIAALRIERRRHLVGHNPEGFPERLLVALVLGIAADQVVFAT